MSRSRIKRMVENLERSQFRSSVRRSSWNKGSPERPALPAPVSAIVLLAWTLAFLSVRAEEPAVTSIGLLLPADPTEAAALRQGALLGVERANRVNGTQNRLVIRGRPGQWGTEGGEAALLALDDQASGLITPASGTAAHEILQVAGRTQVPVVSLCPDSSVTGAGVPWAVRLTPRTEDEARCILETLARESARFSQIRWAALVPPERAGREAARDLTTAAEKARCQLEPPIRLSSEAKDWRSDADQLMALRPGAILLWLNEPGAAAIAQQLREAGFRGLLAGPSRLQTRSFVKATGAAAEGLVLVDMVRDQAAEQVWLGFRTEYVRRFASEPEPAAVMAHDAALLLASVSGEFDRSAPRPTSLSRKEVVGATGPLQFDQSGNRLVRLRLMTCRGGQFRPRTTD